MNSLPTGAWILGQEGNGAEKIRGGREGGNGEGTIGICLALYLLVISNLLKSFKCWHHQNNKLKGHGSSRVVGSYRAHSYFYGKIVKGYIWYHQIKYYQQKLHGEN